MEVIFERGKETGHETRSIPADLYKKIHLLFVRQHGQALFVPIRSMQFLAAIDQEEIVFVDGQDRRNIVISWQAFRPQDRQNLESPVCYQCVYYTADGEKTMQRLQNEFFQALTLLESRQTPPGQDEQLIIPFTPNREES